MKKKKGQLDCPESFISHVFISQFIVLIYSLNYIAHCVN